MLNPIIPSEWFVELCYRQQELLVGATDYQQNSTNFNQTLGVTKTTNTNGPLGNISNTNSRISQINTGSQAISGFGAPGIPSMGGFNNMSIPGNLTPNSFSTGF